MTRHKRNATMFYEHIESPIGPIVLARGDSGALRPGSAGPVDLDDVVDRAVRVQADPRVDARGVAPV